jgi:hypothetical protein
MKVTKIATTQQVEIVPSPVDMKPPPLGVEDEKKIAGLSNFLALCKFVMGGACCTIKEAS